MPTSEAAAIAADLRTSMGKLLRRVKHEDRIPLGQAAVLGALDRNGAMTTSDLAADQRVRPQSMARAVGLLMEQNLITRRAHPTDGRKSLVELSDAGRAALEAERGRRAAGSRRPSRPNSQMKSGRCSPGARPCWSGSPPASVMRQKS